MLKIQQLPEALANKIAAGEVVERPASVVKELVENSIDAKSTWIKIELTEAGLEEIKITDNGEGMSAEDCERAFLRHATSKIASETDLFHIKTLGFRGEALASIASVSRLLIKTSQGNEAGVQLTLEGGNIIGRTKSDARKGTEISVRQLFFNTPARLKYMKSLHTELGHITDMINRIAFAHPEIRFEVSHNNKLIFRTAGTGDLLHVISQVYNRNVAKMMIPIEKETLDFTIKGYIAKPEANRATRNFMTTIINGRYVRHIGLNQAILRGYHTLLPIRRHPITVLHIQMDPILVDANVHPTKLEVRFSKEQELIDIVENTIREALRETVLIPEIKQMEAKGEKRIIEQEKFQFDTFTKRSLPNFQQDQVFEKQQPNVFYNDKGVKENEINPPKENSVANKTKEQDKKSRIPVMYPVGQVQGTYIVAQNEHGMYLIDQHAAQERIKYERFKKQFGQVNKELQDLLLPLSFDFTRQEALIIEKNIDKLRDVGIDLEPFGNQSYIVRSHPTWFPKGFEEESIREIIAQVIEEEQIDIEKLREEAAILMACKRSIKANHYLSIDEMTFLLEDLRKTVDPFTCPHGRPIIVHFSTYELEKMFKRVM